MPPVPWCSAHPPTPRLGIHELEQHVRMAWAIERTPTHEIVTAQALDGVLPQRTTTPTADETGIFPDGDPAFIRRPGSVGITPPARPGDDNRIGRHLPTLTTAELDAPGQRNPGRRWRYHRDFIASRVFAAARERDRIGAARG